ncbi:glycosyltransferase family 2 protein [bacterium]|nr:glycosyltransferase family 2 protein [bacterium]
MSITVIIPTMQVKLNILKKLIELLTADDGVNQILIINNKVDTPIAEDIITAKTEIIVPNQNLYVNESWNLGVRLAKNDKFVLMNDDLLICPNLCSMILETGILDEESTGLVGPSTGCIKTYDNKNRMAVPKIKKSTKPKIIPMKNYLLTGDWGISIFGRKRSYYPIPEDLKIIYGDNYLLYQNTINKKTNYQISELPFHHIHSATCMMKQFESQVIRDIDNSRKYFPKEEMDRIFGKAKSVVNV